MNKVDWAGKYPPSTDRRRDGEQLQDVHFRADPQDLALLTRVRTDARSPYYGLWSTPSEMFRQIISVAARELTKGWAVTHHEAAVLLAQEEALRAAAFIDHRLAESEVIVAKLLQSMLSLVNNGMFNMAGEHLDRWLRLLDAMEDEQWKQAYVQRLFGHPQFGPVAEAVEGYSKLLPTFVGIYKKGE